MQSIQIDFKQIKGVLMSLSECYKQVLMNWFKEEESKRRFLDKIVETMEHNWRKNIFVIEAPTGYGKSTISATVSLFSLKSDNSLKCIIAFPLRTLLEDQYSKFVGQKRKCEESKNGKSFLGDLEEKQIKKIVGKRYMHNPDSRYLIKPITLTTVDTLALTLFGIPPECLDRVVKAWDGTIGGSMGHYLFSWGSVVSSNIVLDEVHLLADSTKSLGFLMALMKIAADFDQKLILMSATIPDALKSILLNNEYFSGDEVEFIGFTVEDDPDFCRDREEKEYDVIFEEVDEKDKFNRIESWIRENSQFSRVIVVFNTAGDAIKFYDRICNETNNLKKGFSKVILIHGRFSEADRERKIDEIECLKSSSSSPQPHGNESLRDYLIISTQVIEAGVDISSNLFITEVAPASSLIQRLGRFLRYSTEEGDDRGRAIIWYEKEEEGEEQLKYKVYDRELVEKTIKWLKDNSEERDNKYYVKLNVHLPETRDSGRKGYKDLLNYVYESDAFETGKIGELIRDFEGIFLHLENASLIAVEKFLEMEGSFVRDELQIPVVPKNVIDDLKDESGAQSKGYLEPSDFTRRFVVPVSLRTFRNKISAAHGVVIVKTKEENGKKITKPDFVAKEDDRWLLSILGRLEEMGKKQKNAPNDKLAEVARDILMYIFRKNVLAFVMDVKYDENLGLEVDGHD